MASRNNDHSEEDKRRWVQLPPMHNTPPNLLINSYSRLPTMEPAPVYPSLAPSQVHQSSTSTSTGTAPLYQINEVAPMSDMAWFPGSNYQARGTYGAYDAGEYHNMPQD